MSSHGFRMRRRWEIAIRYSELPITRRAVAWALSTHMNSDGAGASPGGEELALETGLDRRTVFRALKDLEQHGWIQRSGGGGRGRCATITPTIPPWADERVERRLNSGSRATVSGSKQGHEPGLNRGTGSRNSVTGASLDLEAYNKASSGGPKGADDEDHVDPWTERGISFGDWLRELREQARKARLDGAIGAPDLTEAAG